MTKSLTGRVMSLRSGFYEVRLEHDGREITCRPRGKLKRRRTDEIREDIIAMGDLVEVSVQPDGTGAIESVHDRKRELIRLAPTARGEYKQVLLANPDQIVLVFACTQPDPRLRMLDRFLVICERQGIPVVIAANKTDLITDEEARAIFSVYEDIGYPVIYTSAEQNEGIEALRATLKDKLSGLVGPSGVGKSSLLNAVQPDLGLAVSHVSEQTSKGRHTTVVRTLFALHQGGYVADLPGIRMLALWDIEPEEIDGYFPDIAPLVSDCQFSDCTHVNEPGCAVKAAVDAQKLSPQRYESYVRLRFGEDEQGYSSDYYDKLQE